MYRKNTAGQFICVQLLLTASGAVATGLTPAARRCIDGTFAAGGGTFTEDGTSGSYKYALAQADTNGNNISIIVTATGAIPVCVNFVTTAANPTDSVRFGLTALPNAAADGAGGLPISDAGGLDMDSIKTDTAAILVDTGTTLDARIPAALVGGRMDASVGAMAANVMTAAAAAADLTTELQSGLATAASLATVAGYIDTEIGTIITDVAAVKVDTAAILTDTGTDLPATLATIAGYLDTEVAAIKAKTDNLPADPADASDIAASFTTVNTKLDTIDDFVDTEVAAIKAKTDLIPGTIDGKTFAELVTLMAAVLLGKASGLETTTAIYRAVNDSKPRVTATVDADGNRTAVTLDAA